MVQPPGNPGGTGEPGQDGPGRTPEGPPGRENPGRSKEDWKAERAKKDCRRSPGEAGKPVTSTLQRETHVVWVGKIHTSIVPIVV